MKTQIQTGRNIISVLEVQRYLKNPDASLTGFLQDCISEVSGTFETYCEKGLKVNTYTDIYDGNGKNYLFLNQYPIISISSLQYRTSPSDIWQDFYTGSATANILDMNGGKIMLYDSIFSEGYNNIKIEYTAGFNECPFDLKRIAKEAVFTMYQESMYGNKRLGVKSGNTNSTNAGGYGDSYYELTERHQAVLDSYKKVAIV